MSNRGSFVTEYIYCEKCFKLCQEVLCKNEKWLNGMQIKDFPIIAGKVGGDEFLDFEFNYIPVIQEKMCNTHSIRIAVLSDEEGSMVYEINKNSIEHVKY